MKIYLIGYLYDDFRTEGFEILKIASTIEKAKILLEDLKKENPSGPDEMGYEIREWEVDNADPIGEVIHYKCTRGGIDFVMDRAIPYKVIREEKEKNG